MHQIIRIGARLALGLAILAVAPAAKPPPLAPGEAPQQYDAEGRPLPPLRPTPPAPPPQGRAAASGTGFIVADGRVLTNEHVAGSCARIGARNAQGRWAAARLLAVDRGTDLTLLAVPADFGPPLVFRDGPPVERGETVITYGFPLTGLLSSGPTLTTGDVSALSGLRDNPLHYTISAPVQPGSSGGPLLDAQGHVVGVVVAKLNAARIARMTGGDIPQNVNFAIKSDAASDFLRANGVHPLTAPSAGPDRRVPEIGEIAHPSTLFLQCYR
jgi:S1-C subfamily serine protease